MGPYRHRYSSYNNTPLCVIPTGVLFSGNVHEPHVKSGVKLMKLHDSPITVLTSIMEE